MNLEVYLRRGRHPYISSTFINGFVKDVPLRNFSEDECMHYISSTNNEFGRHSINHSSKKVYTNAPSIQGKWANNDTWDNFPKHLLEHQQVIPSVIYNKRPPKEINPYIVPQNQWSKFNKKRFMLSPTNLRK